MLMKLTLSLSMACVYDILILFPLGSKLFPDKKLLLDRVLHFQKMRLILLFVVCSCVLAAAAPKSDATHKDRTKEKVNPRLYVSLFVDNIRLPLYVPIYFRYRRQETTLCL